MQDFRDRARRDKSHGANAYEKEMPLTIYFYHSLKHTYGNHLLDDTTEGFIKKRVILIGDNIFYLRKWQICNK